MITSTGDTRRHSGSHYANGRGSMQSTYNKEDVCQILNCTCDEMDELFLKDVRKLLRQQGPHGRPWWQEESGLTFNHITAPLQWELLGQYPDQLQARQIPANLTRGSAAQRNAAWDAAHRRTNSRGETVLIPPAVSALDFVCKILKQEATSIKKDKRLQKDNEVGLTPRKKGPKLTAPPHDANTATVARTTPRRKLGKVPLVKSVLTIVPEDQLVEFYAPNDLNEEARETLENAVVKIEFKDLVGRLHRLDRDEKGDIPVRNLRYDLIWEFLDNASLRTHRLEYITDDDAEEPSVVADNRDLHMVVDTVRKQQERAIVDHVLVLAEVGGVDEMDG